jgi:hypothetical protein
MQTRRRSERLLLSFPVLVEAGGEIRRLAAGDVSEVGMLVLSAEPYAVESPLRVIFNLPGTDVELVAQATVRHVTWDRNDGTFRIGIEFARFESGELHPPLRCLPI